MNRFLAPLLLVLLSAAQVLGLVGCAAGTSGQELRTASDQTEGERRARVRLELAGAYYTRGQYDTALDQIKQALAATPLPEAYNLRGLVYAAMGEDRLADDNFQRAMQLSPADGAAMHNRAWFLCQRDRFDEAQAQFQAALTLPQYRDQVRTLLARGVCFGRAGQWLQAEGALMRAYELDPSNPSAGFNLADVLYRRHEYERARFYVGRVNDKVDTANAQTLWLAARIEHRLGKLAQRRVLGEQLRDRFPQSAEAGLYAEGRFDD